MLHSNPFAPTPLSKRKPSDVCPISDLPNNYVTCRKRSYGQRWGISAALPILLGLTVIFARRQVKAASADGQARSAFKISTTAFPPGGTIPKVYTCEGQDISPPLAWTAPPSGARTLVLMLLDPDAPGGIWTHWLVYNLPATARGLAANVPKEPKLPNGARQGRNDFGNLGFGGPCPPPGKPHHYIFHLFALNTALSLEPGATRRELEETIRGHILAQTELVGRLGR